jgi:hypothetical protein
MADSFFQSNKEEGMTSAKHFLRSVANSEGNDTGTGKI